MATCKFCQSKLDELENVQTGTMSYSMRFYPEGYDGITYKEKEFYWACSDCGRRLAGSEKEAITLEMMGGY